MNCYCGSRMKISGRTEYHRITLVQRTFTVRDALLYTISVNLHCKKCFSSQIQYRLSDNTVTEIHPYQQQPDTPLLSVIVKKKICFQSQTYCFLCSKWLFSFATALFINPKRSKHHHCCTYNILDILCLQMALCLYANTSLESTNKR